MNFYKEPKYGPSRKELNWINGCIIMHDNFCGCDEPANHLLFAVAKKSGYLVVKNQQKCLTSGEDQEDGGIEEDTGLQDGELERLFAEEDIETTATG